MFNKIFDNLGEDYKEIKENIKNGRLADAYYLADKKTDADGLILKSFILILLKKYNKALEILNIIKKQEINLVDTDVFYEIIGTCYFYNNNYLEASRYFIKSIELNNKNFYSKYNLANIYLIKKDYQKALDAFLDLSNDNPLNKEINNNIKKLKKVLKIKN